MRTSIGQACANSLARWLTSRLPRDVLVQSRWPEGSVVAPGADSGYIAVVTVYREGKRTREDVLATGALQTAELIPGTNPPLYWLLIVIGQMTQPLQLDIWATSDVDRDHTIDLLDTVLNMGWNQTLGPVGTTGVGWSVTATDDPVRDGIVLPLSPHDGYAGVVEMMFSDPEINDDPDSVMTLNYHAVYSGSARGCFSRATQAPLITEPTLQLTAAR